MNYPFGDDDPYREVGMTNSFKGMALLDEGTCETCGVAVGSTVRFCSKCWPTRPIEQSLNVRDTKQEYLEAQERDKIELLGKMTEQLHIDAERKQDAALLAQFACAAMANPVQYAPSVERCFDIAAEMLAEYKKRIEGESWK